MQNHLSFLIEGLLPPSGKPYFYQPKENYGSPVPLSDQDQRNSQGETPYSQFLLCKRNTYHGNDAPYAMLKLPG